MEGRPLRQNLAAAVRRGEEACCVSLYLSKCCLGVLNHRGFTRATRSTVYSSAAVRVSRSLMYACSCRSLAGAFKQREGSSCFDVRACSRAERSE